jgi:alcohol dehydrogenase class IV
LITAGSDLHARQLSFGTGARTIFGTGSIGQLADELEALGATRVFLVTDRGLASAGLPVTVASRLEDAGLDVGLFSDLRPNPTGADLTAGARALRRFGDATVVGLGGGTALDSAKAISLAAANNVSPTALHYRNQGLRPGWPVIAVPTTAGTGSETNSFGVFEDRKRRRKFYVGHPSVTPRLAILDPQLTTGLPPASTAATGVGVLAHALESLMSRNRNPYAHALDVQVIRAVHAWLPDAVAKGDDLEARSQMLLAAHMAGLAFATSGLGLCHALGHALSAKLGTAHGVALAVTLPSVMEFNQPACEAELGEATTVEAVRDLLRQIAMPSTLSELGLKSEMVPDLVQAALEDVVLSNNPVWPTAVQLTTLVEALM